MGRVDATALIDLDWRDSGRESVLAEVALRYTTTFCSVPLLQFGATGHGGHVDALHLRNRTVKLNGPRHYARCGGIDWLAAVFTAVRRPRGSSEFSLWPQLATKIARSKAATTKSESSLAIRPKCFTVR
jgi:hypothetical protein